ncbi:MAG: hypothetical protein M3X11_02410 [Acidobacteriota bacterium]|nr:hypothetical protein [Acidobacteriota bacterium]
MRDVNSLPGASQSRRTLCNGRFSGLKLVVVTFLGWLSVRVQTPFPVHKNSAFGKPYHRLSLLSVSAQFKHFGSYRFQFVAFFLGHNFLLSKGVAQQNCH